MVNCIAELCRCGGSYTLLRKLWGNFRATLGPEDPLYSLCWNRAETLVSMFLSPSNLGVIFFPFSLFGRSIGAYYDVFRK